MSLQPAPVYSHKLTLWVKKQVAPVAALAAQWMGLRLASKQAFSHAGSLAVMAAGLCILSSPGLSSTQAALAYLVATILRFGLLFASFRPNGVAARLEVRWGIEAGHHVFATVLDLLVFAQRIGFVALVVATARQPSSYLGVALQALGLLMVLVGLIVTLWALRVIGCDGYHYRDLFAGSRSVRLEDDGPYAICRSPIYVFGPVAGYGLAAMALSPMALFAAGLNQALLLVFDHVVEQPWLRRANGIFVETQRRYEIARALLGFDPRQALTQRRVEGLEGPARGALP